MNKYTFVVTIALLFGAYNVSAQNTEKNQPENEEGLKKTEVKKSEVTLKPAEPQKVDSSKKRAIQKARIEEKKATPVKKEED
jgi:hypothetical protein